MNEYPLSYLETKLALTHSYAADDKLITLTVLEGKIDFSHLKQVLEQQLKNYPILQCTLKNSPAGEIVFVQNREFNHIPCTFIQGKPENHWYAILYENLRNPFKTDEYLWEYILFSPSLNKHYLMFTFHHSITDGISSAQFIDQVLKLYCESSLSVQPINARPILPRAELLYANPRDLNSYKELTKAIIIPASTKFAENVPITERKLRHLLLAFTLAPLKNYSKKLSAKINALLTTILLLTFFEQTKKEDVLLSTCVDLRRRISNTSLPANSFGCFFNSAANHFKQKQLNSIEDFPHLVQQVESAIEASIKAYSQPPIVNDREAIDNLFGVSDQSVADHFACDIDTSNLGVLPIQKNYGKGQIKVNAYLFFVNQTLGFSELLFNVGTLEDTVFSHFTYIEPLHSHQWALNIYHDFIKKLHQYIPNFTIIPEWTITPEPSSIENNIANQFKQFNLFPHQKETKDESVSTPDYTNEAKASSTASHKL